jgi:hypothetical protein
MRARGVQRQFAPQVAMLANALVDVGDLRRAAPVVRESVSLLVINGMLWWPCDALACVPALSGDLRAAARLHGWADAQSRGRAAGRRGLASQRLCDRVVTLLDASTLPVAERRQLEAEGALLDDDAVVDIVLRAPKD